MRRVIVLGEETLCLFLSPRLLPWHTEASTRLGPPCVACCSRKFALFLSTFFLAIACHASLLELQSALLHRAIREGWIHNRDNCLNSVSERPQANSLCTFLSSHFPNE